MTNQELYKFVNPYIRRIFRYTNYYKDVLARTRWVDFSSGRKRVYHQCERCGDYCTSKERAVHHVEPVLDPDVGFVDFNTYFARMFTDNLLLLCKECHKEAHAGDAKKRRNRGKKK